MQATAQDNAASVDDARAGEFVGLHEAAEFFGVAPVTVKGWIKDGAPAEELGSNGVAYRLDLRALAAWRKERDADAAVDREARAAKMRSLQMELLGADALAIDDAGPERLTPAQQREALQAELARVKLGRERGELIQAEAVRLEVSRAFGELRERLTTLPDRLARDLGLSDDVADRMQSEIEVMLEDLADDLARAQAGDDLVDHAA